MRGAKANIFEEYKKERKRKYTQSLSIWNLHEEINNWKTKPSIRRYMMYVYPDDELFTPTRHPLLPPPIWTLHSLHSSFIHINRQDKILAFNLHHASAYIIEIRICECDISDRRYAVYANRKELTDCMLCCNGIHGKKYIYSISFISIENCLRWGMKKMEKTQVVLRVPTAFSGWNYIDSIILIQFNYRNYNWFYLKWNFSTRKL